MAKATEITLGPLRVLKARDVTRTLRISRATLTRWVKKGYFPPPHRHGRQIVAWYEDEVVQWQHMRKGESKGQ